MKAAGFGVLVMVLAGVFWPRPGSVRTGESTQPLEVEIPLGDSTVVLAVHEHGDQTFSMLVLHDDENTAAEAGLAFIEEHEGRLVELRAQGERRVSFSIDGSHYDFDPNRIFTAAGIRAGLEPEASEEAVFATRQLADSLLVVYNPQHVIVTLHNNTPDNYSALSYADGGQYEYEAEAVHIEDGVDPDDFFFVTGRNLYDALRAYDFNVVLQNNESATDDGSLSVWAAQNNFPYVNVEAEHGHLEQQKVMIESLEFLLRMIEQSHHTH